MVDGYTVDLLNKRPFEERVCVCVVEEVERLRHLSTTHTLLV